jgi:hypothetical protein
VSPDDPPEEDALHEQIVQAVARGMNQLLPPEFRMTQDDSVRRISRIGPSWLGGCGRTSPLLDEAGQPDVERVVGSVELMLERLQTHVTVALTVPWPPVEGHGPGYFAFPMVEWRDGTLRLWFASHEGPVRLIHPGRG